MARLAMIAPLSVGDSLAVGMAPYLHARTDARVGRPLAEGIQRLRAHRDDHGRLYVGLGTNDAPGAGTRHLLHQAVLESLRGRRCVVWATLYVRGRNYSLENRLLIREHRVHPNRLQLVGWATRAAVLTRSDPLGAHPTAAGYRLRAQLFERAARRC